MPIFNFAEVFPWSVVGMLSVWSASRAYVQLTTACAALEASANFVTSGKEHDYFVETSHPLGLTIASSPLTKY